MGKIRVLIVDDHQLVIDGIKLFLSGESDLVCVGHANDGLELIKLVKEVPADVILLDMEMPRMNGLEVCKYVQKHHPQIRIIVLSMLQEASVIRMMLAHGAKGYLLKNSGKTEILRAIREVCQGKTYFSQEITQLIMQDLGGNTTPGPSSSPFPRLSRREKQVLRLIVEENITREIAEKLQISTDTVETHRRKMLSKLGVRNTAGLVRVCMEYKLLEE